jgi:predicted transcriptional regulator
MKPAVVQRVLVALDLMIRGGYGIMEAAKEAGTTRRAIRNYLVMKKIRTYKEKGKLKIAKNLKQRMYEFIQNMADGDSATKAARKAKTTVKTMSKQEIDGNFIIEKVDRFWEITVYPLHTHSMVIYGHIIGLGDNIQGKTEDVDGEIKSPDAPDIWWQIDFDEFDSTLDEWEVGEFYSPKIVEWLRNELQMPLFTNDSLVERFIGHEGVEEHALDSDRVDDEGNMLVSSLENLLSRYNVRLHEVVNYGIDDNHPHRQVQWVSKHALGEKDSLGRFQIFFVKDEPMTYPKDGPLEMVYEYNLNDERL